MRFSLLMKQFHTGHPYFDGVLYGRTYEKLPCSFRFDLDRAILMTT